MGSWRGKKTKPNRSVWGNDQTFALWFTVEGIHDALPPHAVFGVILLFKSCSKSDLFNWRLLLWIKHAVMFNLACLIDNVVVWLLGPTAVLCFSLYIRKRCVGMELVFFLEYHLFFCLSGMRLGKSLSAFLYSRWVSFFASLLKQKATLSKVDNDMEDIRLYRLNLKQSITLQMKHFLDNTFYLFNLEFCIPKLFIRYLDFFLLSVVYGAVRKNTTNIKIACYLFAFCVNQKAWGVHCE